MAAPRGVPQIEVSFNIDANGIVNVSAKDLGTGKEQNITITASSNLSKEDIDKAVKEAEQFAAEDKKQKDIVETHNNAEQFIYQMEKTLENIGDKATEEEKKKVVESINNLKEKNKSNNIEEIKLAIEQVNSSFYPISEKMYKESQTNQSNESTQNIDSVVDTDYEIVD